MAKNPRVYRIKSLPRKPDKFILRAKAQTMPPNIGLEAEAEWNSKKKKLS